LARRRGRSRVERTASPKAGLPASPIFRCSQEPCRRRLRTGATATAHEPRPKYPRKNPPGVSFQTGTRVTFQSGAYTALTRSHRRTVLLEHHWVKRRCLRSADARWAFSASRSARTVGNSTVPQSTLTTFALSSPGVNPSWRTSDPPHSIVFWLTAKELRQGWPWSRQYQPMSPMACLSDRAARLLGANCRPDFARPTLPELQKRSLPHRSGDLRHVYSIQGSRSQRDG
jgi:hypothetical protein